MTIKFNCLLLLIGNLLMSSTALAADPDYPTVIDNIGQDIAELKSAFPQLSDFSADKNVHAEQLQITYQYNTHKARHYGGWTAGVPNPDSDGIWFYLDIHDAASNAQIHTQPVTLPICLDNKRVSFLILEGDETKSIQASIWGILKNHGIKPCGS